MRQYCKSNEMLMGSEHDKKILWGEWEKQNRKLQFTSNLKF